MIMNEKILTTVATKKNVLATKKKKLYKKPTPIKFIQRDHRFKGTCLYCGSQVSWGSPPCGKG